MSTSVHRVVRRIDVGNRSPFHPMLNTIVLHVCAVSIIAVSYPEEPSYSGIDSETAEEAEKECAPWVQQQWYPPRRSNCR